MSPTFSFDAATHAYTQNGICVPSVTRCLDHAGLVSFDMVKRDVLEKKSTIGTLVHLATEFYDEGKLDWDSLDHHTRGRTEAWASFREDTGFVPRIIERQYLATVNGMTFGLTADREGFFKNVEAIIDIKTSASVEPWCGIQTAGYALGVPDTDGHSVSPLSLFYRRRRLVVQLFPDGKYKKYDFDDRHDATVFISALHITHWKLGKGSQLRKIDEQ